MKDIDNQVIEILLLLSENNMLSQRGISTISKISLGKVNGIIKDMIEEQYIVKECKGAKIKYNITDKGLKVLSEEIKDKKSTRIHLHQRDCENIVKQGVILAAGKKTEFNVPEGLIEIEDVALIDRNVKILMENGIEDIIIVTGYMSECYEKHFRDNNKIKLVKNEEFEKTGSMASLDKASEYIVGDFILLESDIIFERMAIVALLEKKKKDCMLITNTSGLGDEVFVELRDGYIFKMSKDKRAFNSIHGEIAGIVKISKKIYDMMREEFKSNTNPIINYEYILIDVARDYKVGYVKIDDLMWGEIDTNEQYSIIKNSVFPAIKKKDKAFLK